MIRKLCMITLAGFVALGLMTLPPVSGTAQAKFELLDYQTTSLSNFSDAVANGAAKAFDNAGYSSGDSSTDTGSGSGSGSDSASSGDSSVGDAPNNGSYYVVSAIGDSLTENSYFQSVLNSYFSDPSAHGGSMSYDLSANYHGLGGYKTGDILDVMEGTRWGDSEGADYVMIMAGTNDAIQTGNNGSDVQTAAGRMVANIQEMVNIARGSDGDAPSIIVSGIIPSLSGSISAVGLAYNQLITTALENVDLIINTNWYDLVDPATNAANGNLMSDYAHPNATGYDMMAENYFEAINAFYNTSIAQNNSNMYPSW